MAACLRDEKTQLHSRETWLKLCSVARSFPQSPWKTWSPVTTTTCKPHTAQQLGGPSTLCTLAIMVDQESQLDKSRITKRQASGQEGLTERGSPSHRVVVTILWQPRYKVVLRRNEAAHQPSLLLVDASLPSLLPLLSKHQSFDLPT